MEDVFSLPLAKSRSRLYYRTICLKLSYIYRVLWPPLVGSTSPIPARHKSWFFFCRQLLWELSVLQGNLMRLWGSLQLGISVPGVLPVASQYKGSACTCLLSRFSHIQLFTTAWTIARQAPLSMGFSRQEYWSGWPCPPPGDLPHPETEPASLTSTALTGGFLSMITT